MSIPPWRHNICFPCWRKKNPDRDPVRVVGERESDRCCFCGAWNLDGIYLRENPADMLCNGNHEAFLHGGAA